MSKVPIQNIYYLLCYAWDRLDEKDIVDVKPVGDMKLLELFAKVLINGLVHLRKRGIDRGYIPYEEDTGHLRGKIKFNETLKRQLLTQAKVHCEFAILSHNVLHNRIIRSTITTLIKSKEMEDEEIRSQLYDVLLWLADVEPIQVSLDCFRRVQLHRNNAFYGFLLNVCELIHQNLLVSELTGETRFRDFLQDEKQMAKLFELFVRNFYRREQSEFSSKSDTIEWDGTAFDDESEAALPKMHTDISLTSPKRKIIIDTKYYREALTSLYSKDIVRPGHLYQIYAYIKNYERRNKADTPTEGVLLYPTVHKEFDLNYELGGHPVRALTLNLNQDWKGIYRDLMALRLLTCSPKTGPA
jgi:5-methylcytosine-specific restriction enzyme subunit McrC